MSNEKFTPGEWVTRPGNTTVLDKNGNPIAMVYRAEYYRSKEESFANVELIKAAPPMYRVLSGICLEKSAQICKYAPESCKVCSIRKALKKVRGEDV